MDISAAQSLYKQLIDAWNNRNASAFGALFANDGICIGYDGSEMFGKQEISSSLATIFRDHPTAKYVSMIRGTKNLDGDLLLLRAHVGMLPPNKSAIDGSKNAIQVMVARINKGAERIILFQNTPAQYHGRPEMQEKLTKELQQVADKMQ